MEIKEEAEQELEISNRLRKMPLAKNYFILNDPESCEIAPFSEQKETDIPFCGAIDNLEEEGVTVDQLRQIYAPFGGYTTFYKVLTTSDLHPTRFDFFAFTQHLLEAGATMAKAGVCHFDLHPGNLLVDTNGVVRVIDFGLSFLVDHINTKLIDDRWKVWTYQTKEQPNAVVLNQETPEITIWNGQRNKLSLEQSVELVVALKPIFRDMEKYLGISRTQAKDSLIHFWRSSKAAQEKDEVSLFKLYWPGFDAWAIGCILLYVLKASLLRPEFVSGIWSKRQAAVYGAIRGLLDVNPRTRMDCVEALATFDPNSDWIQRFGKTWLEAREKQHHSVRNGVAQN